MAVDTTPAVQTPEAGPAGIQVTLDKQGLGGAPVATLVIDQPGRKVNVMNVAFIDDLERALDSLPAHLAGLVVTSGKEGQFLAGADLEQLLQATEPAEVAEQVRRVHRVLARLAALPYPSVAAINGPALGGGLELALACDYRVCTEQGGNILGSPEVQLGLLPAGGATQRLPRLIGLSRALGLILESRRYNPKRARRYGVVDETVHPAVLRQAAVQWLARGKRREVVAGWRDPKNWPRLDRAAARWPLLRALIYRQAARTVRRKSRGHYPAPLRALEAVRAGQEQGFGAGLAAEAAAFGELATGPAALRPQGGVAHNLIQLFFATEALKKEQRALAPLAPQGGVRGGRTIDQVGVVGSGFMGSGIAQVAAAGGYGVRVRDVAPESVARGLKTARDLTLSAARKGRFSRLEAQDIVSRLSGTTDWSGFARAQLVIEAVFEDVAVKRQVIHELEGILAPEAVIASNTSSLPIGGLAAEAAHPERIVGMHFFSPVHRMPLLEVIRAEASAAQAVATAVEAGQAMGKTVIVVRDGPGFYTTRVLSFMMEQAGQLFEEGAPIESIDRAMTAFGFPVGPMALMDEVGLEVATHVSEILGQAFGDRFPQAAAASRLVAAGRLGRKNRLGFYDYRGRKKKPDPAVYALRSSSLSGGRPGIADAPPRSLIQRRLVLALINEAARCLDEGIIASPRDGDVGAVFGFGFPPFLGGPFRYADSLGLPSVLQQLHQMEYAYGAAFAPADSLQRLGAAGGKFYESGT